MLYVNENKSSTRWRSVQRNIFLFGKCISSPNLFIFKHHENKLKRTDVISAIAFTLLLTRTKYVTKCDNSKFKLMIENEILFL